MKRRRLAGSSREGPFQDRIASRIGRKEILGGKGYRGLDLWELGRSYLNLWPSNGGLKDIRYVVGDYGENE